MSFLGSFSNKKMLDLNKDNVENHTTALNQEDHLIYEFQDGEWLPVSNKSSIGLNLYELNKNLFNSMPPLTKDELNNRCGIINSLLHNNSDRYYLMYGKESGYFTLFDCISHLSDLGKTVLECLDNFTDKIYSISPADTGTPGVEIWVEYNNTPTCLYLFPYDMGIVKVV